MPRSFDDVLDAVENENESLKARLAEVERERDRARDCHEETAQKLHSYIHLHAVAESRCAELVKALESIRQYGSDTLSGRADGGSDDRQWQREAAITCARRVDAKR